MYPYDNQSPNGQQFIQDQQGNWNMNNPQGFSNQGYSNQGFNNQGFVSNNQLSSNQSFSNNTYNGYPNNEYNNFNNQQFYGGPSFDNNQFSNNNSFSDFNIPDEFIIKEKLLTIGMDMKLLRDNQQFGYIKQKMFSLGRTF
jgi:hypothetical protein